MTLKPPHRPMSPAIPLGRNPRPIQRGAKRKTQHLGIHRELPAGGRELFRSLSLSSLVNPAPRDNPNIEAARTALRVAQAEFFASRPLGACPGVKRPVRLVSRLRSLFLQQSTGALTQ
jgi:hypothetical protein